ncbi:MAG: type VI secretion system ATPase TssH, partial [Thermoleophilia bacterium]|nr:type VI secretion system ATPase TssH [Thermoleophilia bacterium]
ILLTSNLATDLIVDLAGDPEKAPGHDALAQAVRHELLKAFKPAFLGRMVVVPYRPLSPAVMAGIARMQLDRIGARVREHHGATFTYDDALVDLLIAHCNDAGSGARNIDQLLNRRLMPDLSRKILARMAEGIPVATVKVSVDEFGEIVIDVG